MSVAHIVIKYDGIDGGGSASGKSVEKSSKSPKKHQRSEKLTKIIGSEECLSKHCLPSIRYEELKLPLEF